MAAGNGDRTNRQVKATAAYADLSRDIKELRRDLLDEDLVTPGAIIRLLRDIQELKRNPMVRLGFAMNGMGGFILAGAALVSGIVGFVGGLLQVGHWLHVGGL